MSTDDQSSGNVRTYAGQGYSWKYLARKFRISKEQEKQIIRKVGHDPEKLNAAAEELSVRGG